MVTSAIVAVVLLVVSVTMLLVGIVVVICVLLRNKRMGDAFRKQAERWNAEMWVMIDTVQEAGHLGEVSKDNPLHVVFQDVVINRQKVIG